MVHLQSQVLLDQMTNKGFVLFHFFSFSFFNQGTCELLSFVSDLKGEVYNFFLQCQYSYILNYIDCMQFFIDLYVYYSQTGYHSDRTFKWVTLRKLLSFFLSHCCKFKVHVLMILMDNLVNSGGITQFQFLNVLYVGPVAFIILQGQSN